MIVYVNWSIKAGPGYYKANVHTSYSLNESLATNLDLHKIREPALNVYAMQ